MHSSPLVAGPRKCRSRYRPSESRCGSFVNHHDSQGNVLQFPCQQQTPLLTSSLPVTSMLTHPGTSGGLPGSSRVSVSWSTHLLTSTLPVTFLDFKWTFWIQQRYVLTPNVVGYPDMHSSYQRLAELCWVSIPCITVQGSKKMKF